MTDPFAGFSNISSQGESWSAVTPSDTVPLATVPKALWIDVAGTVRLRGADGNDQTFTVPNGFLDLRPVMVLSTGTTATGIKAIF